MRALPAAAALLFLTLGPARSAIAFSYRVLDLNDLIPGAVSSQANGINSAGDVVGQYTVADGSTHPFLYGAGVASDIGGALTPTATWRSALAINDSGLVVGYYDPTPAAHRAFTWQAGVTTDLEPMGTGDRIVATKVNNAGQISGWSNLTAGGPGRAYLRTGGVMKDLGALTGDQSNAFGLSSAGDVAGWWYDGTYHAYVYPAGASSMTDLTAAVGGTPSFAASVNTLGVVVGYTGPSGSEQAWRYDGATLTNLGALLPGSTSSRATEIDDSGRVLGSFTTGGVRRAFLYQAGVMRDLGTFGGTSADVADMNGKLEIAGSRTVGGVSHAVLASPVPELIAHYTFDAASISGSSMSNVANPADVNATIAGATATRGLLGDARLFDGVDDYVDLGAGTVTAQISGTNIWSISVWVSITDPTATGQIVYKGESAESEGGLRIGNGAPYVFVQGPISSNFSAGASSALSIHVWHHLVGIRDSETSLKLYVDGALAGSGSGGALSITSTRNVLLGPWQTTDGSLHGFFEGSIDELKVFDHALSVTEVAALFAVGGPPPAAGLVGHYSFNDPANPTADDSAAPGHPLAATGTPAYLPSGGFDGSAAYSFAATGDRLRASGHAVSTTAGARNTVTLWVRWDGTNNVMPFSWEGLQSYDLWFMDGGFGFNTDQGDVWGVPNASLANRWVHVAAVFYNGLPPGNVKLYIDGAPQTLSYLRGGSSVTRTATSGIVLSGYDNSPTEYFFHGRIDDVRIYDRELDASEIGATASYISQRVWSGGGGSSWWGAAANWSPTGLLASGQDVRIPAGASPSALTTSATVRSLTLQAGFTDVVTFDGPLTIEQDLVVTSGTLRVGTGSLAVAGSVTVNGGTLRGSISGAGGPVTLSAGGTLKGNIAVGRAVIVGPGGRISPGD